MDGYEATRRLRAQGYAGPIVALTAHAMADDRQACLDAGCNGYMAKPVERQALLSLVAQFATGQPPQPTSPGQVSAVLPRTAGE
jgi:CheY-like chemotaxis protein